MSPHGRETDGRYTDASRGALYRLLVPANDVHFAAWPIPYARWRSTREHD